MIDTRNYKGQRDAFGDIPWDKLEEYILMEELFGPTNYDGKKEITYISDKNIELPKAKYIRIVEYVFRDTLHYDEVPPTYYWANCNYEYYLDNEIIAVDRKQAPFQHFIYEGYVETGHKDEGTIDLKEIWELISDSKRKKILASVNITREMIDEYIATKNKELEELKKLEQKEALTEKQMLQTKINLHKYSDFKWNFHKIEFFKTLSLLIVLDNQLVLTREEIATRDDNLKCLTKKVSQ